MALADALIAVGEKKLVDLQGPGGARQEIKQAYRELMSLGTQGMSVFTRSTIDMQDFAEVIDQYRKDLRPWIMVYPAALGLLGPWESVMMLWANTDPPSDQTIAERVSNLLHDSFRGYVRLISI